MTVLVTHVTQSFSRGGAGRALLSLADTTSTIVSLTPADTLMRARAEAAGATILEGTAHLSALEAADVVLVHFWNTPELYEFLRGGLPPVRLVVWAHVAGNSAPQVITRELLELVDAFAVSAPGSAQLPVFPAPPRVIPAAADPARVSGAGRQPHTGFTVGYVGTLDFAKLHPRFAELCAAVDVADARFIVCGVGEAAATLGQADARFELRGYVEEIGPVLAELDVLGYPLAPGNYATSDLALQEAMSAGIPPVVLAQGNPGGLVEHGVTGLVARDEADYPRVIEHLAANPDECLRLGANARAHARLRQPADVAQDWRSLFTELLERPKAPRRPTGPLIGAQAFVESLGATAPEFAASLTAENEEDAVEAEARIAEAPPALVSASGGGILHYRRHYPNDVYLRLWSALVLEAAGRNVFAVGELVAARQLGCDAPRVSHYMARAETALRVKESARAG